MTFQIRTHRKNVAKQFWKGPTFEFISARLNCIPQNRQCHQIITMYLSVYRSFTGTRQHLDIRNTGDLTESPAVVFRTTIFTNAPSITRYHKLIGDVVRIHNVVKNNVSIHLIKKSVSKWGMAVSLKNAKIRIGFG